MAIVAVITTVDVGGVFAGRRDTVMTGSARAQYLGVVNGKHGHPDITGMAVFADIRRLHMRRTLTGGFGTVMAAEALARDVHMIEIRRQPGDRRVTVVAVVATGDVGRVFTGRRDAVMAGTACAYDLGVVDRDRRRPHIGRVAVCADIGRLYVCQVLAGGIYTVMATDAIARDVQVIEVCRSPGDRRVTIIAGVIAGDVRRMFAGRRDAVMAGTAHTDDMCMVNRKHGHKHISVVAVFADVASLNMCRRFLAGGIHTVVAVDAASCNVDVIEVRGQPGDCRVAIIAGIAARNVRRVLAGRIDAVMT